MYIKLTEKCNMSCPHCGFSCTAKGRDMSIEVFRASMELVSEYDSIFTLGGGEPTMHPQFELVLLEAISNQSEECTPHIITNGKITKRAMMVYHLTKKGVISAELSRDDYHDDIDNEVVTAFEGLGSHYIRDTSQGGTKDPLPHGRGVEYLGYDTEEPPELDGSECLCEDHVIRPDGSIFQCGCADAPQIGDVRSGYSTPSGECCHSSEFASECIENDYEHLLV